MGIKKLIKQQNLKQKKDIAPNSKAFRSWFLRKIIDNDKNNSTKKFNMRDERNSRQGMMFRRP